MLVALLFRVVEYNGMVELESSFNPVAADQEPQVNTAYRFFFCPAMINKTEIVANI